ncbi:SpoIIIAH-like family protein [Paenibacillus tyrfis]|uniref:SpoIIIAH-like family protein n=1 Tax=Paenibacillus tyrfis TaxID=1501230 RepID=UPI002646A99E|nr:SpoIIIAH-like family protein [Paenibacillus tyrfis]
MNSKRQTIWLVSMLSLMVVLSAYYLFTEDVGNVEVTGTTPKEMTISAGQTDAMHPTATDTNAGPRGEQKPGQKPEVKPEQKPEVKPEQKPEIKPEQKPEIKPEQKPEVKPEQKPEMKPEQKPEMKPEQKPEMKPEQKPEMKPEQKPMKPEQKPEGKPEQKPGKGDKSTSTGADIAAQPVSKNETDAKVLQQVQAQAHAQSGNDYFVNLQLKRNEEMAKKAEQLLTIIADPKQTTEAAVKAQEELRKIEDMEAKVTNLEESLTKDFPQAVVTQDSSKWKVTVQASKLEKSQALSIIDKTIKELSIGPDSVSVQMIP